MNAERIVFRTGKTTALVLLEESDAPQLTRWINDPEITRFLTVFTPNTLEEEIEWIKKISSRQPNEFIWGIWQLAEKRLIGTMGLHRISYRDRVATTGAIIGEKDCWGQGFGRDAKMQLLDFAFNTLNLRKICSSVLAFNERSFRYSLACGYQEEGRRKLQLFSDGQYRDEIFLAVFREDWLPLWAEYQQSKIQEEVK
ncbi:MAG: GNAT family protein [Candidatus Komeilibacteria bacterium]|nr:GNAT family protein [Candidatus Komeilibacteria bacterium]